VTQSTTLLGHDYPSASVIFTRSVTASIAVGISVGKTIKPNQDALAVAVSENAMLLAIADGHWGDEAGELAVRKAVEMFRSPARLPDGNELRGRLFCLFEQINRDLSNQSLHFPGAPTPETTLIVCYLRRDAGAIKMYWASFGDSYLFLKTDGAIRQINTLYPRWLGALSKMAESAGAQGIFIPYPATRSDHYLGVAAVWKVA
jgi:serine/threonine protein phosphatase PrpC